ncbi:MAG TPA: NAD(P)/FAD-dependent oxidoreductase [Candidatus Dormibacteraeota bacterium]|nr:NAD(P)/FAD-dependent oxidoreductase [Candidatus Dormibacteraeota bacterium]
MTAGKRAQIAGAGYAGLMIATLLAKRGWDVTVHERSEVLREIGAGIFLHSNGLVVLEEAGLMEDLAPTGERLLRDRMVDYKGRVMQERDLSGPNTRRWSFPRQAPIEVLQKAARRLGVEVRTQSAIKSARPEGVLVGEDGAEYEGDLVIGADGHRSAVRGSLGLTKVERRLPTTSIRFLLPGRDLAPDPMSTEYWSRRRRIALAACGPDHTYCYMACPQGDLPGSEVPINVESWSDHFPQLHDVFQLLRRSEPFKAYYSWVRAHAWSKGKVALLGDAAHALPPTLGQGSNLAMSNARSLVTFLEEATDVPTALAGWERSVRDTTEATQKWARYYDQMTKYWPNPLSAVRARVIWAFGASPQLSARMRRADRTPPITDPQKAQEAMR